MYQRFENDLFTSTGFKEDWIRQSVLLTLLAILNGHAFDIGFFVSRDIHSGGFLIGIPIVVLASIVLTALFYFRDGLSKMIVVYLKLNTIAWMIAIGVAIYFESN